jgi:hypothetical protein
MISSQQPMMIDLAKNFERLVKDPKVSRKDFDSFFNFNLFFFLEERGRAGGNESVVKIAWDNPE